MKENFVNVYYININSFYDQKIFIDLYNQLPDFKKADVDKIKIFENKVQTTTGFLLLTKVLKERGYKKDIAFKYNNFKKPYLKDRYCFFNLSHSKDYVSLIVSNKEVGIDIQYIDERNVDSLIRFVFSDNDLKEINEDNKNEVFNKIWTIKEAYSKYIGKGLSLNMHDIKILENRVLYKKEKKGPFFDSKKIKDKYNLSFIFENNIEPIIMEVTSLL